MLLFIALEDINLSFTSHALSKRLKPPLCSVDICELGLEAATLLLEKINGEKAEPRSIMSAFQLIERALRREP